MLESCVQIAVEIPYMFVQVLVFSAIVYPMAGFELIVTKLFWFVLYMTLSFIDFTLFGMMVVALTPNEEIAAVLSFFIFMLWNTFAGFIVPRKVTHFFTSPIPSSVYIWGLWEAAHECFFVMNAIEILNYDPLLYLQMIPVWWRWMYWADPAAWTIYGLMSSQLGDRVELIRVPGQPDQPVSEFMKEYLGLQDDYLALVITLHIAMSTLFGVVFCLGIKYLKFQRR